MGKIVPKSCYSEPLLTFDPVHCFHITVYTRGELRIPLHLVSHQETFVFFSWTHTFIPVHSAAHFSHLHFSRRPLTAWFVKAGWLSAAQSAPWAVVLITHILNLLVLCSYVSSVSSSVYTPFCTSATFTNRHFTIQLFEATLVLLLSSSIISDQPPCVVLYFFLLLLHCVA